MNVSSGQDLEIPKVQSNPKSSDDFVEEPFLQSNATREEELPLNGAYAGGL